MQCAERIWAAEMLWLRTWTGKPFGFRDGDDLWTERGRHVGVFYDREVYGPDGRYLGELMALNRLVTDIAKKQRTKPGFAPKPDRDLGEGAGAGPARVLRNGFEDFPTDEL
jgi:hypothetical protein